MEECISTTAGSRGMGWGAGETGGLQNQEQRHPRKTAGGEPSPAANPYRLREVRCTRAPTMPMTLAKTPTRSRHLCCEASSPGAGEDAPYELLLPSPHR